jgi:hypothetical protein
MKMIEEEVQTEVHPLRAKHREAMKYASRAQVAKFEGDMATYRALYEKAYKHELEAVKMVEHDFEAEPTRSVLYRSAASMAYVCKRYQEAEKLIGIGLAGNPPHEIAEELRDLFNLVNANQHLAKYANGKSGTHEIVSIEGELRLADARAKRNALGKIEIVQEDGTSQTFSVPLDSMNIIVRPFYGMKIIASGIRDEKGQLLLQNIDKARN